MKAYYFPKVRRDMEVGFTITMCYCPSFESPLDSDQTPCNSGFEYTQEIGAMRWWHYLLCDLANYVDCGYIDNKADPAYVDVNMPYARVTPHQPFVMKIICPPGGCVNDNNGRMRLLTRDPRHSDKMGWDSTSLCRQWNT